MNLQFLGEVLIIAFTDASEHQKYQLQPESDGFPPTFLAHVGLPRLVEAMSKLKSSACGYLASRIPMKSMVIPFISPFFARNRVKQ